MIRNIRRRIAAWLDPDVARLVDHYWYLQLRVQEAHRWLGERPDAADLAQWLLERDADHWRTLGTKSAGKLPQDISDFRDHLRRRALNDTE